MAGNGEGMPRRGLIYSVGHSNVGSDGFIDLLAAFDVEAIADVRTVPRSGYVPHFDQASLSSLLKRHGRDYVFLGDTLGGRPKGDEFYDERGYVLYYRVASTPLFKAGIGRLLHGARNFAIAMLCAEEDPAACHRHRLVAHGLEREGMQVQHIRHDGTVETTADVNRRIVGETQDALFDVEDRLWISSRSVLQKRTPNSSSERSLERVREPY